MSEEGDVRIGGPQGTTVDSIFCIIYVNNRFVMNVFANIFSYANNTVLVSKKKTG